MPDRDDQPARGDTRRWPAGARFVLWLVISLAGLLISLQLIFAAIEVARPLIGPIPDDSIKERLLVVAAYALWFAISALLSVVAWRRLRSS